MYNTHTHTHDNDDDDDDALKDVLLLLLKLQEPSATKREVRVLLFKDILAIDFGDVDRSRSRSFQILVVRRGEIEKVRGAMTLVVIFLRIGQLQRVFHVRRVLDAHEVVIPRLSVRDHVIAVKTIG